ncbi:MAG: hypothetical protein K2K06_05955 [Oscillospiraceae bacterium]|nr:hypothetical protein [Ruminococcus sp.]MDE6707561.1 hypothetical protein [Oscillospiraceae bacterium]
MMNDSKNYLKKIILTLLIASCSIACFGCNQEKENNISEEDTPRETMDISEAKLPLTFIHDEDDDASNTDATKAQQDAKEDATENKDDTSNTDSNTDNGNAKSSTAAEPEKNVAVTEHVEVTDASGQPVTDSAGTVQTQVVNVTEQVKVTDASGQAVTDSAGTVQTQVVNVTEAPPATEATQATEAITYTPTYDVCRSYWLDMSQQSDFFFEGEFLVIEFQVNENIPDGNYPITFKKTDIASWDAVKWDPVCIDGEVAVNSDLTAQENLPDSDFGLKINSVAVKQGETATVTVDLANNPGFCGFVLEVEYDKSAMKIVSTSGGADFGNAVHYITD